MGMIEMVGKSAYNGNMRILVVEDEKILAKSIKTGLVDEKFAVDVVHDGKEGYDLACTEEYDVVILDRMLPNMDGVVICQKLRKEQVTTPIIMLTARDTIEDKIAGLNSGADDYVIKPFSFEELLARIHSLIRRTQSTTKKTILQVDSLLLDPIGHTVKRAGKEVKLTGKEYALLEYFMYHAGQILTREKILSHVWDYSYDSFSNVVDVLVKRLREKIDDDFPKEKPLFATIRGLGYKLG
jgi:DNA-binding response OmpR family regulator